MKDNQMQNEAKVPINKDKGGELYKKCIKVDRCVTVTFWINVALALLRVLFPQLYPAQIDVLQIIVIVINIVLSIWVDDFLLYNAECERRKFAVQDGFGIELGEYTTDGYYTNQLAASENRYFIDLFESNHYTKDISKKMIPIAVVKTIIALAVLAFALRLSSNPDLVLVAAETVFSSVIIAKSISLPVYVYHMEQLYKVPYRFFITSKGNITSAMRAEIMHYAVEYEAVKAHYKVQLSVRIYEKNKHRLAKEWDELRGKIKQ